MEISERDWLEHVGVSKRDGAEIGSGRYPLGSGENPYQDYRDFKNRVTQIKKAHKGITEKELVTYLEGDYGKMSIRQYRDRIKKASAEITAHDYLEAHKLREKGWSYDAIAEKQGRSATGVRDLLKRDADSKSKKINNTAEMIRESLDSQGGYIDIGAGSELICGVSRTTLDAAVRQLEDEGYSLVKTSVKQLFGQGNTTIKAICPPGTTKAEVFNNMDKLRTPVEVHIDKDGNKTPRRPIENVSSDRIMVRYAEDGGTGKDGVIELRRGVADLDLGNARYAQVRIGVDGTHYLKGVAIYADDLPDGVDIRFNTSKHVGTPLINKDDPHKQVLKTMPAPENLTNPFGSAIKAGGQQGALNIVYEEGDWSKWSKTLASQFLSKQYEQTARRQLKITAENAVAEFEEIKKLTNPTVKRYYLEQFANSCESDAVHLKAARLPGQTQKVLLPLPEGKPNECYCPSLDDGTPVALVRYPHGGTFEIPTLTVNNNNAYAKKIFGNADDAIGIHPSAASVLSGADFDGDTAMVIPLTGTKVRTSKPLAALKDFDPKTQFNGDHLSKKDIMSKAGTQAQMGMITNLITDMTVVGNEMVKSGKITQSQFEKDLSRAVAHSMVVIDAHKHQLDYKASEKYFDIKGLREKYGFTGGASTLLSKSKGQQWVLDRREKAPSKMTPEERERWERGEKIFENTGKTKRNGELVTIKSNNMAEVSDANELSYGTRMESYYADYANKMKDLANQARAELRHTGKLEYNPSARVAYADEVTSLSKKLKTALMNAPLERKAQALANSTYLVEKADHPEYDKEALKKAKSRHLEAARDATGAGKVKIDISDREWEAIQAGAIHDSRLIQILSNSDSDKLRQRAMPRGTSIDSAKIARARSLMDGGYTWAEAAEMLGVSVSGLQSAMRKD